MAAALILCTQLRFRPCQACLGQQLRLGKVCSSTALIKQLHTAAEHISAKFQCTHSVIISMISCISATVRSLRGASAPLLHCKAMQAPFYCGGVAGKGPHVEWNSSQFEEEPYQQKDHSQFTASP